MPKLPQSLSSSESIEEAIRRAIESGRHKPGARLPDERKLAATYGVSRPTVRQALASLAQQRLIERVQGRGTFVRDHVRQRMGYIAAISIGEMTRYSSYVSTVLAQAERSAQRSNCILNTRFVDDPTQAVDTLKTLCQDTMIVGGLIIGSVDQAMAVELARASTLPWVMLGDIAEQTRFEPVLPQVVGDPYRQTEVAAEYLIDCGARRAACLEFGEHYVWNRDSISAFRTVMDGAGVGPADQQIVSFLGPSDHVPMPADPPLTQHRKRNIAVMRQTLDRWAQTEWWPEGVIVPGTALDALDYAVAEHSQARQRLSKIPIVVCDFEERQLMAPIQTHHKNIAWALVSMAAMTDDAVQLIQAANAEECKPTRRYVRSVQLVRV